MVETKRKTWSRISESDWRTLRLRVLLGQTWIEIGAALGRNARHLKRRAAQLGLTDEAAPGELAWLAAGLARQKGIAALVDGDQAAAAQALRIAVLIERGLNTGKGHGQMTTHHGGRRQKPVDRMSEAELREELARILGIETKSGDAAPGRDADAERDAGDGETPVPDELPGRTGPAAG